MLGSDILNLLTEILGDEAPSQTYMLSLINMTKTIVEAKRPWKVLSTKDTSQTVTGSNTYLNAFPLPANFYRYLGESELSEGSIKLFDGSDNKYTLTEVPIENILDYRNEFGKFAVDYNNKQFFICGIVPGTFTIYQYYIQTTATITANNSWEKFPSAYYPQILAFATAARWRLGTDWDEIASNNADDNVNMYNMIFEAMSDWDNELALAAVNSIDYVNSRDCYFNNNNSSLNGFPR